MSLRLPYKEQGNFSEALCHRVEHSENAGFEPGVSMKLSSSNVYR